MWLCEVANEGCARADQNYVNVEDMLHKRANPAYRRYIRTGATVLFVTEAILFAGSYFIWHRMNTSRDFRLLMRKNYPWALDAYYSFGEILGEDKERNIDLQLWSKEGKLD